MSVALHLDDVWKSYAAGIRGCSARVWVLRGVSIEISAGERVAIVGAPGAGKSTLLQCAAGERKLDAGSITGALAPRQRLAVDTVLHDAIDGRRVDGGVVALLDDFAGVSNGGTRWRFMLRAALDELRGAGAVVVATRDAAWVSGFVDRILVLRHGSIMPFARVGARAPANRVAERRPQR
jgi:ABC-type sulfate/molybdate transport systems ATPase subunit